MNLPTLDNLKVQGKRVLLRLDLDVPVENGQVLEDLRLRAAIPTIKYLQENKALQIIILGHRGRPEGKFDENLTLKPVENKLREILIEENLDVSISFEENLRFNPGEEANDSEYTKELAQNGDVFINDAFGVTHREAASIVGLPKLLPHAAGLHLQEEIEQLEKVLENPKQPVVFVIAGGKPDKAVFIEKFLDHAEFVLVGGALAASVKSYCREKDGRMCIVAAHLTSDGKDITPDSARNFIEVIKGAQTIVWNGPMGDIDNNHWEGTELVGEAIANSSAFKIAGGGDTIHALNKLNLFNKMDYVSMGGGAMLEFLAYKDLPGLRALRG